MCIDPVKVPCSSAVSMAHGPTIAQLLWGGYGRGNSGDDLTLAVAMNDARRTHGESVAVLAADRAAVRPVLPQSKVISFQKPRGLFRRLGSFALMHRSPWLGRTLYRLGCRDRQRGLEDTESWIEAIRSARSIYLVGGGYLTDRFDLENFLPPLRLAVSLGIPISSAPLGLGPFSNPEKARQVVDVLRHAELQVRDQASLEFCRLHGLSAVERIDDGFRWREVVTMRSPLPQRDGADSIGVCIFSQYSSHCSDSMESWWVDCLRALIAQLPGFRIEGFCFHTRAEMDYETARRLFARAGLDPNHVRPPQADFRAAIQDLSRYRAVLSTRFHAVVTASGMDIPCVAMAMDDYYEIKMRAAMKHAPESIFLVNLSKQPPEAAAAWLVERFRRINAL